jgi:hypothetical protein
LLRRGIGCGAFVDPWNILGFQGLFPLFHAREDSLRDPRIDELVQVIGEIFNLYSRLTSEAAAMGNREICETLLAGQRRLAAWWDRFASVEVHDVPRVHGGESAASAEHVATALTRWHERGETAADLAFWREHLEGFQSPKAFVLVVDALLHRADYRAAMGLLMNWLGQAEQIPLEEGIYSFHTLALRWLLGLKPENTEQREMASRPTAGTWPLIKRFFDYLEANADEYWQVPDLEFGAVDERQAADDEDKELYRAAYDDVTYHDSADDDQEGSVADGGEFQEGFDLEPEAERLAPRLRFLSTLAQLWQIGVRQGLLRPGRNWRDDLKAWLDTARANKSRLLALMDAIQAHPIPAPLGSYDSLVEYDRRRSIKEHLLYAVINTCLDTQLAVGTLEGALGQAESAAPVPSQSPTDEGDASPGSDDKRPAWELLGIELEQALLAGAPEQTRQLLPQFLDSFQSEPLLFTALSDGGQPRLILRVRAAQAVLRALVTNLPRLGLLRETYHLLRTARSMEQAHPPAKRGVTEFNQLFQSAYQAVVGEVVDSAADWPPARGRDQQLVDLLETLTRPFLLLWIQHSQTLQLSTLETLGHEEDWQALRTFVKRYGHDLFHAKFMTLANLRGILHRGVSGYLDYLRENADPLQPIQLMDDLDQAISRADAERWLQWILQALVENYEEYKDYNTTTPQSDYGENLHQLLDFLRLKANYQRHAWRLRPLILAHEVLARSGRADLAASWQEAFVRLTDDLAEQYVQKLAELERTHGMRLRTVGDLVQERFVKPMALDRLCALIEPAMEEAQLHEDGRSFTLLERELQPLTANPTGVGLDVPQWLRQLGTEVQRVRAANASIAHLAEEFLRVPQKSLTIDELREQLDHWEEPLVQ